jgi:hypothetical protein
VLKVRDRAFDPSLFEFQIGAQGLDINATSDSAETLLADLEGMGGGRSGWPASPSDQSAARGD